jgi:hypothetical protein
MIDLILSKILAKNAVAGTAGVMTWSRIYALSLQLLRRFNEGAGGSANMLAFTIYNF